MLLRQEALAAAVQLIRTELETDSWSGSGLPTLKVEHGGRRSSFGPVPWIRVYDPDRSPSATAGFYIVYLFGGLGSHLYLSLNQGTSEWRSGKMRPVTSEYELAARAASARDLLVDVREDLHAFEFELELEVGSIEVGSEAKQRVRNYELGNVVGLRYPRSALPADGALAADLRSVLPLLGRLLGNSPRPQLADRLAGDTVTSQAVSAPDDVYAAAVRHFESTGWNVRDHHLVEPYSLECTRDGDVLHVLCKIAASASHIRLTRLEMLHARAFPQMALFVRTSDLERLGLPACPGDPRSLLVHPWVPQADRSVALGYIYRLAGP